MEGQGQGEGEGEGEGEGQGQGQGQAQGPGQGQGPGPGPGSRMSGHGGADFFMMDAFVRAISTHDKSRVCTGPEDALNSHLLVFRIEQARKTGAVVEVGL